MSAPNYEAPGAEAALAFIEDASRSQNQGEVCKALGELLDALSGDGEIANGSRRGAAAILANVIECGLAAIRSDRMKKNNNKKAGESSANDCLANVSTAVNQNESRIAIVNFLCDIAGDGDTKNAKRHGAAEILAPIVERGLVSLYAQVANAPVSELESGAA